MLFISANNPWVAWGTYFDCSYAGRSSLSGTTAMPTSMDNLLMIRKPWYI